MGVSPEFFSADNAHRKLVFDALKEQFDDLKGRFGVTVLGTFDDDRLMVGPSLQWPWTCYILADVPDLAAAIAVCNILRESNVGSDKLWRYLRIEARVGRPLFFGTD